MNRFQPNSSIERDRCAMLAKFKVKVMSFNLCVHVCPPHVYVCKELESNSLIYACFDELLSELSDLSQLKFTSTTVCDQHHT